MNSSAIAARGKQAERVIRDKRRKPTDGDLAVMGRRAVRNRDVNGDFRSNPLNSSVGRNVARPLQETSPSGYHVERNRRALLDLRSRLQGSVTQTADAALSGCGIEATCASPDTADRASEVIEQGVALGLLCSANGTLDQIETALQRIHDGSFGHCAECHARIPAVRLEAIPYATRCVQCAARHERTG